MTKQRRRLIVCLVVLLAGVVWFATSSWHEDEHAVVPRVTSESFASSDSSDLPIVLPPQSGVLSVDVQRGPLQEGIADVPREVLDLARLRIRVVDEVGHPIAGAQVLLGWMNKGELAEPGPRTGADGEWIAMLSRDVYSTDLRIVVRAELHTETKVFIPFLPATGIELDPVVLDRTLELHGRVLTERGRLVEDAKVTVRLKDAGVNRLYPTPVGTTTGPDGRFTLQLPSSVDGGFVDLAAWSPTLGGPGELQLDRSMSGWDQGVELRIPPMASVIGTVVDQEDHPVASARITGTPKGWYQLIEVVSDSAGQFEIPLTEGIAAKLSHSADGYLPMTTASQEVVSGGAATILEMVKASRLTVVANDGSTGEPLAEFRVEFCAEFDGAIRCYNGQGKNGLAELDQLPPGDWRPVTVSAPGYDNWLFAVKTQFVGENVGPVEVWPAPSVATSSIGGRVLSADSKSVERPRVSLYADQRDVAEPVQRAVGDEQGRYRFDPVAAGRYLVLAEGPRGESGVVVVEHGLEDSLADPVILAAGGDVFGVVSADVAMDLSGVLVGLEPQQISRAPLRKTIQAVTTTEGSFRFDGVPAGRYRVTAWKFGSGERGELGTSWLGITVRPGKRSDLVVPLSRKGLRLRGQVRDWNELESGASVRARILGPDMSASDWSAVFLFQTAVPLTEVGGFEFTGLRTGRYELSLLDAEGSTVR